MALGIKQKHLLELGKKKGKLTIYDVRKCYGNTNQLTTSMRTLEILGYFKKRLGTNGYEWIYLKDDKSP